MAFYCCFMLILTRIRRGPESVSQLTLNPGSTRYTLTFCTLGLRRRIHDTADSATLRVLRRMSANWIAWLRALATPWKKLISWVINTGLWGSARVSIPRMPITRRSWSLRGKAMNEPSPPWERSYLYERRLTHNVVFVGPIKIKHPVIRPLSPLYLYCLALTLVTIVQLR